MAPAELEPSRDHDIAGRPGEAAGERPVGPADERPGGPAGERPGGPAGERPGTPAGERPGPPAAGTIAREAARKLIHLATAAVAALLAWSLPTGPRRALFGAVAAFALAFDLARLALPGLRRHFERALGPMLRGTERRRISGATTLAVGFLAAVALFPRVPAVAGLLYAGCGDAAGALVGRALGRHRFPWGKSLEGSLAVLAVVFLVAWTVPALPPLPALAVALALALLEGAPLPFDDNLLLPAVGAGLTFFVAALA